MHPTLESASATIRGLLKRFEQLEASPPIVDRSPSADKIWQHLRSLESQSRIECQDILCNVANGEPLVAPLPKHQAYFLACRCRCALDTIELLSTPNVEGDDRTTPCPDGMEDWLEANVLEWFLIAAWDRRRDEWLKLTTFAILTRDSSAGG